MKPPTAPPSLHAMSARVEQLEFERRRLFTIWKAALEAANGNITKAAEEHAPPLTRNQANKLTHRLGLVEYAAELRRAMTGQSRGTPKRVRQEK